MRFATSLPQDLFREIQNLRDIQIEVSNSLPRRPSGERVSQTVFALAKILDRHRNGPGSMSVYQPLRSVREIAKTLVGIVRLRPAPFCAEDNTGRQQRAHLGRCEPCRRRLEGLVEALLDDLAAPVALSREELARCYESKSEERPWQWRLKPIPCGKETCKVLVESAAQARLVSKAVTELQSIPSLVRQLHDTLANLRRKQCFPLNDEVYEDAVDSFVERCRALLTPWPTYRVGASVGAN